MGKNLVYRYSGYCIGKKDKIQNISGTVVANAFFSKGTLMMSVCESDIHVISRFRNDVVLYYPTQKKKTGKHGHPKWFEGGTDFANPDPARGIRGEQRKAIRIECIRESSQKSRFLSHPASDGREDRQASRGNHQLSVKRLQKAGFSPQRVARRCQTCQSGTREKRNSKFQILPQVIHTQRLYA